MPNVDTLVQDGIAALKAGKKEDARRALMKAVELDEHNEQGWLWLSACVETNDEQQICLENVLAINPNNEKARKGLAALGGGTAPAASSASPAPSPAPAPDASAAPDPFAGGFDSNPFAGTGFDSNPYGSNPEDPAVSSGWDTFDSGGQSTAPASSVDWNRDNKAPAYGSGKDVPQPSPDEYDNWVSGLSLGGAPPSSGGTGPFSGGFETEESDPFSGAAKSLGSQFGAPASSSSGSTPFDNFDFNSTPSDSGSTGGSGFEFGSGPFASASESFDDAPDPFGSFSAKKSDPFPASDAFGASAPPPRANDPFGGTASAPPPSAPAPKRSPDPFAGAASGPFGGTPEDPVADLFDAVPGGAKKAAQPGLTPAFGRSRSGVFGGSSAFGDESEMGASSGGTAFIDSAMSPGKQAFFKAIPPEIQASGGKTDFRLIATVAILALLNMMSIALLLLNIMKR